MNFRKICEIKLLLKGYKMINKAKSDKKNKKKSHKKNKAQNTKANSQDQTNENESVNPLVDLLNSDHIIQNDDMAVTKALSHVYHHDVYDTLGMLDELRAILVDDEDLKAIHQARELFTAIKYIKENLITE